MRWLSMGLMVPMLGMVLLVLRKDQYGAVLAIIASFLLGGFSLVAWLLAAGWKP